MKLVPVIDVKLTPEQCFFIRKLRCGNPMHSWRRIAELFCQKFHQWTEFHGNQLFGIELCEKAAEYYKEDAHEEPWN